MKTSFHKFMASNAVNPVKVELSLADDLKKSNDDLYNKVSQIQSKMILIFDDLKPLVDKIRLEYKQAVDSQAKAKELGVDSAVKTFVDLAAEFKQTEKLASKLMEYSYNARKGV
jgi:hypothetical protein